MNKLASFSRYAFIPLFLIFLLVSCRSVQPLPTAELSPTYTAVATIPPTQTPTLTPQNTPLPTLTLTSTPTPTGPSLRPTVSLPLPSLTPFPTVTPDYLVYPTKPVFISYGGYGGDGGENTDDYYGRFTPKLIIYSDGHILIRDGVYQESITFWEAFLTPAEMCNLLQQIEATGFLQEHEIFFTERTGGMGAGELIIEVEDVIYSFYGPDTPYLIEELANGSQLISDYRPPQALAPYAPLYLALWIEQEAPNEDETLFSWPTNLPTLAELWSMRGTPDTVFANTVIVEGEWVTPIFDLFSRQLSRKVFHEGDITYSLIARPLLPHETPRRIGYYPTYPTHYAPAVVCDNEPSLISPAIPTATPTLTASANQLTGQGRILFVSGERRQRDIYVIDANGNNRLRLTNNLFLDEEPAWSPDGRQIAFTSNRDGGGRNIFIMDVDGTNIRQLTDTLGDNYSPGWSPDGQQIVFVSDRDKGWQEAEIYLMNADGTEQRRLTQSRNRYLSPVWSPDGRKIFALKELTYMNFRLAILYFHEGEWIESQLSDFSINSPKRAAWSPDSSQIAIPWSPTLSEAAIRIINLNGREAQSFDITPLELPDSLSWSANGSYILFSGRDSSERERIAYQSGDYYLGNWGVYALDTFSGEVIQITFGTQDEFSPAWWP